MRTKSTAASMISMFSLSLLIEVAQWVEPRWISPKKLWSSSFRVCQWAVSSKSSVSEAAIKIWRIIRQTPGCLISPMRTLSGPRMKSAIWEPISVELKFISHCKINLPAHLWVKARKTEFSCWLMARSPTDKELSILWKTNARALEKTSIKSLLSELEMIATKIWSSKLLLLDVVSTTLQPTIAWVSLNLKLSTLSPRPQSHLYLAALSTLEFKEIIAKIPDH